MLGPVCTFCTDTVVYMYISSSWLVEISCCKLFMNTEKFQSEIPDQLIVIISSLWIRPRFPNKWCRDVSWMSSFIWYFFYLLIGTGRVKMKIPKRAQSPPRTFPKRIYVLVFQETVSWVWLWLEVYYYEGIIGVGPRIFFWKPEHIFFCQSAFWTLWPVAEI